MLLGVKRHEAEAKALIGPSRSKYCTAPRGRRICSSMYRNRGFNINSTGNRKVSFKSPMRGKLVPTYGRALRRFSN